MTSHRTTDEKPWRLNQLKGMRQLGLVALTWGASFMLMGCNTKPAAAPETDPSLPPNVDALQGASRSMPLKRTEEPQEPPPP